MPKTTNVRGMEIVGSKLLYLITSKLGHLHPHSKEHLRCLKAVIEEYALIVVYPVICRRIAQLEQLIVSQVLCALTVVNQNTIAVTAENHERNNMDSKDKLG